MNKDRKIFFVVASGGQSTPQHYFDTIKNKRTIEEASHFLDVADAKKLREKMHGQAFAVWGAVPGDRNVPTWEGMEEGDYLLIYRDGKIILASEVALKVRNPQLSRHYWKEDANGKTWELMFFLYNDNEVNVPMKALNAYLGYAENYHPQGFMAIEQKKVDALLSHYGDLLSFLAKIEAGKKPEEIDIKRKAEFSQIVEEKVERAPTEHDEMQWRLIRLGNKSHFDVWVPPGDQHRSFEGNDFRKHVIPEFQEAIDVPSYIKNIDTVWKLGLSIKSAFEIEHSTSIYSGILRLSDLRTLAPNSNYPLFIVASKDRKTKVFDQLRRPTFSSDYLQLDRVVHFLSYDSVRKLDDDLKDANAGFDLKWLMEKAESHA
ncbi:MAG: hypothetical protein AAB445_01075 [Patescibacteria group bacterium]